MSGKRIVSIDVSACLSLVSIIYFLLQNITMPVRKRGGPRRGRKGMKARKGGRRGYRVNNNMKSLNPIAQRYICKLKYAEVVTSAAGSGSYGLCRWNLNNLNQPNRDTAVGTGTSHQPYGLDQLTGLYNRFRVISCKYRIFAQAQDGSTLQVAVIPSNELLTIPSISSLRESPRTRYTLQGTGAAIRPISGKVYLPSLMGRTSAQYMADDRYQAQTLNGTGTLAGPSELALLQVIAGTPAEIAGVPAINFNVQLEYTCEFFDIKQQSAS